MPDRLNLDKTHAALRRLDSGELVGVISDGAGEVLLEMPDGDDREVVLGMTILSHRIGMDGVRLP